MSKMSYRAGSKVGGKISTHFRSPRKLGLGSVKGADFTINIKGMKTKLKDTDDRSMMSG